MRLLCTRYGRFYLLSSLADFNYSNSSKKHTRRENFWYLLYYSYFAPLRHNYGYMGGNIPSESDGRCTGLLEPRHSEELLGRRTW